MLPHDEIAADLQESSNGSEPAVVSAEYPLKTAAPPARGPGTVVASGIAKEFSRRGRRTHVLGPLDVTVGAGQFVAVVGASGCGKTTLLRLIAGLIRAERGEIRYRDQPVTEPVEDLGMVFQQAILLDWFSVLRNVTLQLEARGIGTTASREEAARSLLALAGVEQYAERRPYELSGGQQQRVALCRALVHSPGLLLMDEPFGAIDAFTREHLQDDLEKLWLERHPTVVFVTHDVGEAVRLADRVLVMKGPPGLVVADIPVDLPRPRIGAADLLDPNAAHVIREVRRWVVG